MRKIRITESQAKALRMMSEAFNQGAGVAVAAKTDATGKVTQQTLTQQDRELTSQGLQNAKIEVDQDNLHENTEKDSYMNEFFENVNPEQVAQDIVSKYGSDVISDASPEEIIAMMADVLTDEWNIGSEDMSEGELAGLAAQVIKALNSMAGGLNESVKEIMNTANQIYNARALTNDRLKGINTDKDPEKVDRVYKKVDKYIDKKIDAEKDPSKKKRMMFAKASADNNSSMALMENGRVFTKKQLKEARLNKLVCEAKRTISKKDFKNA